MSIYEVIALIALIAGILMLWYRGTFVERLANFVGKTYTLDKKYETAIGAVLIVGSIYYIYKYTNWYMMIKNKVAY